MTGPLGLVPPPPAPPARRYFANLRDVRRGGADPLTTAVNGASDTDPVLREMLDSEQSGIVFVASLKRFVVLSAGKGEKVSVTAAATREDAEQLFENAPGRPV